MNVALDAVDWGVKTAKNIKVDYLGEFPNPEHISPFQYDVSIIFFLFFIPFSNNIQPKTHPDLTSAPNFMFNSAQAFIFRIYVTRSKTSTANIHFNNTITYNIIFDILQLLHAMVLRY